MPSTIHSYRKVEQSEDASERDASDLEEGEPRFSSPSPWKRMGSVFDHFHPSLLLNVVLALACLRQYSIIHSFRSPLPPWPSTIHSPAESVVSYETITFTTGLRPDRDVEPPPSVYFGEPTDETDAAWQELYETYGISQINAEEAAMLPNKTAEFPDAPGQYVVGLDVFHQLHCLDFFRKKLRPERYGPKKPLTEEERTQLLRHDDHCIDSLRQSLMCSADISTIFWDWKPSLNRTIANMHSTHTCRNFQKIKDWAVEHQVLVAFDSSVKGPDAGLDPSGHHSHGA